ncbi:MAG: helix-turn-helix domain-containing protein [Holophaga sp.]|nr:helix-turn-helix domain-containing protein [Holophaga sp.]
MTQDLDQTSLGAILRGARVAKGLSQQNLAQDLRMPVHLLAAIEADDWPRVPPGRERPLARRIALHVGLDLESCVEAWNQVPGALAQEAPDPKRERLERILTGVLTAGSVALLLWLVVPGRGIKGEDSRSESHAPASVGTAWVPRTSTSVYPVLGEVLPEAPINADGILVNLRALDTCTGKIAANGLETIQTLRVSEPWTLRVKGPFTLALDNAGVVTLEVAGRRILHGVAVGEPWTGRFDDEGRWILPEDLAPKVPLHIPQSETEAPTEE